MTKQTLLIHEIKEEFEYVPSLALEIYDVLIPKHGSFAFWYNPGYGYAETDEEKIIELFEMTKDSVLGDMIFAGLNTDYGSDVIERDREG